MSVIEIAKHATDYEEFTKWVRPMMHCPHCEAEADLQE
jgi:hypothetical protein